MQCMHMQEWQHNFQSTQQSAWRFFFCWTPQLIFFFKKKSNATQTFYFIASRILVKSYVVFCSVQLSVFRLNLIELFCFVIIYFNELLQSYQAFCYWLFSAFYYFNLDVMKLIKNIQIYKANATFKCGIVVYFYLNCSFHSAEIKPSLEIQLTKRHYEKALNQQQRCDLLRF